MKTTLTILIVTLFLTAGCSPWRADVIWTEGCTVGRPKDYVTWRNQWRPTRAWTTQADSVDRVGDERWIPWETERIAEQTGVFER